MVSKKFLIGGLLLVGLVIGGMVLLDGTRNSGEQGYTETHLYNWSINETAEGYTIRTRVTASGVNKDFRRVSVIARGSDCEELGRIYLGNVSSVTEFNDLPIARMTVPDRPQYIYIDMNDVLLRQGVGQTVINHGLVYNRTVSRSVDYDGYEMQGNPDNPFPAASSCDETID